MNKTKNKLGAEALHIHFHFIVICSLAHRCFVPFFEFLLVFQI
jgi:hypothetical protein